MQERLLTPAAAAISSCARRRCRGGQRRGRVEDPLLGVAVELGRPPAAQRRAATGLAVAADVLLCLSCLSSRAVYCCRLLILLITSLTIQLRARPFSPGLHEDASGVLTAVRRERIHAAHPGHYNQWRPASPSPSVDTVFGLEARTPDGPTVDSGARPVAALLAAAAARGADRARHQCGAVLDEQGAVLPGVTITLRQVDTNTDADGGQRTEGATSCRTCARVPTK
jgi:hypothetical protein